MNTKNANIPIVGGTLLVVDDEVEIREVIELFARPLGMDVLEACDGEQALEVIGAHQVDLIVSDLIMPRLSGLSLLEALRQKGSNLPFVIVTAYPSRDSTVQALRHGAFDYVEKPFEREDLQRILAEAMAFSLEQQKILPRLVTVTDAAGEPQIKVEQEILKLRHLAISRRDQDTESRLIQLKDNLQMRDLFVTETMSQLNFCSGALRGLANVDTRAYELGYLFRVMQALADAAAGAGFKQIQDLAAAAERLYTILRVKPRAVDDEMSDLLIKCNNFLMALVQAIATASSTHGLAAVPVDAEIQRFVDLLMTATRRLEGPFDSLAVSKAS